MIANAPVEKKPKTKKNDFKPSQLKVTFHSNLNVLISWTAPRTLNEAESDAMYK